MDHGVQTDQVSIRQVLDVRRTIEMRTVGLAALRRTDREAREIVALAAAMRADFIDTDKVIEHDIAFHETIARASRNLMFALLVGSFHVVMRQTWRIGWADRATSMRTRPAGPSHSGRRTRSGRRMRESLSIESTSATSDT